MDKNNTMPLSYEEFSYYVHKIKEEDNICCKVYSASNGAFDMCSLQPCVSAVCELIEKMFHEEHSAFIMWCFEGDYGEALEPPMTERDIYDRLCASYTASLEEGKQ